MWESGGFRGVTHVRQFLIYEHNFHFDNERVLQLLAFGWQREKNLRSLIEKIFSN